MLKFILLIFVINRQVLLRADQNSVDPTQQAEDIGQQGLDTAHKAADSAKQDASDTAQQAEGIGQQGLDTAQKAADSAKQGASDTAQQADNTTQKAPDTAQQAADTAQEAADTAQQAEDTAHKAEETAQKAAGTAQEAADTAQKAADPAKQGSDSDSDMDSEMYRKFVSIYGKCKIVLKQVSEIPTSEIGDDQVEIFKNIRQICTNYNEFYTYYGD